MWDALRLDVRHSFRSLRRAPTFSLIVIVTLALAVGATAAVGSLLNALVFRTTRGSQSRAARGPVGLRAPGECGGLLLRRHRQRVPRVPALLRADVAVRRRRYRARRGHRGAFRRVRERRDGSRLAELLRHGRRASIGGTVLQRIRRRGRGDQRGVPPAHLRECFGHRRGNQARRGTGDGDRHRGGRFRRSPIRRQFRHHRALRGDASGRRRPVYAVPIETGGRTSRPRRVHRSRARGAARAMAVRAGGDAAGGVARNRAGGAAPSAADRGAARVGLFGPARPVRHHALGASGADGDPPGGRVRQPCGPDAGAVADAAPPGRDSSRAGWKRAARVLAAARRRDSAVDGGVRGCASARVGNHSRRDRIAGRPARTCEVSVGDA